MKLASKLSHKLSRKLAIKPFGYSSLSSLPLTVPTSLKQLLLHDNGTAQPAYYTEAEWSGKSHLLKDYSLNKGTFRDKRQGYCYDFDGVDDRVDFGVPFQNANQGTLSFWFKVPSLGPENLYHYAFGQYSNVRPSITIEGNDLHAYWQTSGGGPIITVNDVIEAGVWYHAALVADVPNAYLYLNGVLIGSSSSATPITINNVLALGTLAPAIISFFAHDARYYTTPLTAEQIAGIYARTYVGSPFAHYPLQEQSGTTAYDISGNGNHGTIMNVVTSGVGSIHQPDAGVTKSYPNDEGYTPAFTVDDTLIAANVSGTNNTLSFKIRTTQASGIAFTKTNSYLLVWSSDTNNFIVSSGFGSPEITVDEAIFDGSRDSLRNILSDGEVHSVVITNVDLSVAGTGLYYGGYPAGFALTSATQIWDVELNGESIPGPTLIPAQSTTQDALGGTLTETGEAPLPGLMKGWAWQGDGSSVYVDLGEPIIPATADFELAVVFQHKTTGSLLKGILQQYKTSNNKSLSILVNNGLEHRVQFQILFDDATTTVNLASGAVLVLDKWYKAVIKRTGADFTFNVTDTISNSIVYTASATRTVGSIIAIEDTELLRYSTGSYANSSIGPVTITTGGVTTTYSPIKGTRNVAVTKSDGTYNIIYDAVKNGVDANLYTLGDGSWRLPEVENGANWDGTALVPAAPGASVAANGNAITEPAGKHSIYGGLVVDRSAGVVSPMDIALGLDQLINEDAIDSVYNISGRDDLMLRARNLELIFSRSGEVIKARA